MFTVADMADMLVSNGTSDKIVAVSLLVVTH